MAVFGNDARVNATFTATDKASPVVKSLRSEIGKLGNKTGGPLGGAISGISGMSLGMIGLVTAGVGAVGVMGDFAKQAIDDQQSVEHMTAALKANIPAWDGNTAAIDAFIQKGQDLAFTDDDIRNSISQLVTRTHDVTKAISLTREAMDLARLKTMSLSDAAGLLGKVYSGQTAAARRAGIAIDNNANSTEALAQIQKAAAGQAETYAKTTAGTLDRIGIVWSETTETLGYGVLTLIDQVGNLGTAFDNLHRFIDPNYAAFEDMRKQAIDAAGAFGLSADAVQSFIDTQKKAHDTAQQQVDDAENEKKNLQILADQAGVTVDELKKMLGTQNDAAKAQEAHNLAVAAANDPFSQFLDDMRESNTLTQRNAEALNASAAAQKRFADAWHQRISDMNRDSASFKGVLGTPTPQSIEADAESIARAYGGGLKSGLEAQKKRVAAASADLNFAIKHPFAVLDEYGHIVGQLTGDKLAKGLRSKKPEVRAEAEAYRAVLRAELSGAPSYFWGSQVGKDYIQGLRDAGLIGTPFGWGVKFNTGIQSDWSWNVPGYNTPSKGGHHKRRGSGGPYSAGDTLLVGETGPEVLHMGNRSGYVTQGRGAGWQGGVPPHSHPIIVDGRELGVAVGPGVDEYQGRRWSTTGSSSSRN